MALPFPRPSTLPPGFTMSRCTPADVPDTEAFVGTECTYWWGPNPAMRAWNEERIRRRFVDPNTQQFKVVDDASGEIVAWSKWDPPPRMTGLREGFVVYNEAGEPIDANEQGGSEVHEGEGKDEGETSGASAKKYALGPPEGSNAVLFREFFDSIVGMEKKYNTKDKLVLTHLCARPTYHSRGIGAALLDSVLQLADKEGLPAYLESTRFATTLYKRHGFEVVDKLEFDRTEAGLEGTAILNIMIREPRVAGGN
ncbi:hypothetical protein F5Y19DRAFT_475532 [Xylariaceae sp. FL1651]|nr:hypothetical protein F5Y19DRAFT_475532 [Xylariaceae sp. FL1651]